MSAGSGDVGGPFPGRALLPHHRQVLRDSAIADEVICARGYFSVSTLKEARDLGFAESQSLTPALVVPVWGVDGQLATYVLRPDMPRLDAQGKVVKYEQRRSRGVVLDVPPVARSGLGDPSRTLYITEGAKKADALVSRGACAVSITGVWAWRGTNSQGGKVALPDWECVAFNERLVRVVFDSDVARKGGVAKALQRLNGFLESRGASVEAIYLPDGADGRKQGVDDFLANGGTLEDLVRFVRDRVEIPSEHHETDRPAIVTSGRHLDEIVEECWRALDGWRGRHPVFERGGRIVTVKLDDDGAASVHCWEKEDLAFVMERAAHFKREVTVGDVAHLAPDRMPRDAADDMLVAWAKPLPKLRSIVNVPHFTKAGVFDTRPGYQPESLVYYAPVGPPVPEVPVEPSAAQVEEAKALLYEWLWDFPFDREASRAHAIVPPLTALVREVFDGPTPLYAVDTPTQGTGKGLYCHSVGIIVTGNVPAVTTLARDTEEERKRYTALLREGASVILIDNVKTRLDSPVLASALTADVWRDRILGVSETVQIPNRALWMANGNNLQMDGEIARRTIPIRMDAKRDKPWERTGFKHDPLLPWVKENRARLIYALAVLVRHWFARGCPPFSGRPLGSFEEWSRVGGILECGGIPGFLGNRDELLRRADEETEEWRAFVAVWWERFEEQRVKAAALATLIKEEGLLPGLRGSLRDPASEQGLLTKLGKELNKRRDRRIGELFVRCLGHDLHAKGTVYALQAAEPDEDGPGGSAEAPHDNPSSSGSFAEGAEPAEPDPDPRAREDNEDHVGTGPSRADRRGARKQAPQAPHPPQSDSDWAEEDAEDGAEVGGAVHEAPQGARCVGCGMTLSVVAVSDRCGRCQVRGSR